MQQGFGILHTVSSIYVVPARTSLSRFPAAVEFTFDRAERRFWNIDSDSPCPVLVLKLKDL